MSFKVIGIGEALWDLLPNGPQVGGAPANFACHAHGLGAMARVISRVGNDPRGLELLRCFRAMGLPDNLVQIDDLAHTGTVTVTLNGAGIPQFLIHENVAWDRLTPMPAAIKAVQEADAICFGSLAQRSRASRNTIQQLVAAAPAESLRVFDVNLRQHYFSSELIEQSLYLANVLKLNDQELPVLADIFDLKGSESHQIKSLAEKFHLRVVVVTRGDKGSILYERGRWSNLPASPVQVKDTIGAGDAFTAGMVMGFLHKMDLDDINRLAGEIGAFVCSHQGATPPMPRRFRDKLDSGALRRASPSIVAATRTN